MVLIKLYLFRTLNTRVHAAGKFNRNGSENKKIPSNDGTFQDVPYICTVLVLT